MSTPVVTAGLPLTLAIGQRVRHCNDYRGRRVTGVVQALGIEDRVLMATVGLDEPIVIPPGDGFGEIPIYRQHVPAHELAPFDARNELLAELASALQALLARHDVLGAVVADQRLIDAAHAALAKFKGGAA